MCRLQRKERRGDVVETTSGTGTVLAQRGDMVLVVTNHHFVIDDRDNQIRQYCLAGETGERPAVLVGLDQANDLALFVARVGSRWATVELAAQWPQAGRVTYLGYSFNGPMRQTDCDVTGRGWISVRPNPSDSGGAVIDTRGRCVGIIRARINDGVSSQTRKYGLAVPVEHVHALWARAAQDYGRTYPVLIRGDQYEIPADIRSGDVRRIPDAIR